MFSQGFFMKMHIAFLMLLLLSWSSASQAFSFTCIGKDKTTPPANRTYTDSDGNTHDTDEWKNWKNKYSDWAIRQNWSCCEKLVLNTSTRVCEDPSMKDPDLQSCTAHGACGGELGCYTWREDDMFNTDSEDLAVIEAVALKEQQFDDQQDSMENEAKPIGGLCYRNMECESYKCEEFKCVDNKICREASDGEEAPGNILCEEPLAKTNGVCGDQSVGYFAGLLGGVTVQQVPNKQCQFELYPSDTSIGPKEVKSAANLAIVTSRSMEWMFNTQSAANHRDCLNTTEYMKKNSKDYLGKRKEILKAFNEDYLDAEANFTLVNKSQKGDMSAITTFCGDTTTKHDVAMRKTTGLDFLCYMKARNALFKEYETAMNGINNILLNATDQYKNTVFTWGAESKSWTVADKTYSWENSGENGSERKCRGGKKKKVKKRWAQRYKVKGEDDINKNTVEQPGVKQFLNFIGAGDDNAYNFFVRRKYWLLDPLLPGGYERGVSFGNYGTGGDGGSTDFRRKLKNDTGYSQIYAGFKDKIVEYYAGMHSGNTAVSDFIYEPEIPSSYEQRGCVGNIDDPKCKIFKNFVTTIQDSTFAQMLAYSGHKKKKYKYYFLSEGGWRRKLFARYQTDLTNLSHYYPALVELRDKQNACLDKVIGHLKGQDFNGQNQGIAEGGMNYFEDRNNDYLENKTDGKGPRKPKIKQSTTRHGAFKLAAFNMTQNSGALRDSVLKNSGGASASLGNSVGGGSLAARTKAMEAVNAKALAKGVDVAKINKEFHASLSQAGLLSASGVNAMASRGGSALGSSSSSKIGSLEMDKSVTEDANTKNPSLGDSGPAGAKGGAAGGVGGGASFDLGSGMGSGSVDAGSASGGVQDASGMSDEEKDMMSANYDRNKGSYKTKEDDSLFQAVSKTYVRNLDKILTRKKKIDDSLAAPINP